MSLHILRTPMREVSRKPEQERFAFCCRKRGVFELVVTVPVDEMSYYGPSAHIECPFCLRDCADFPGTYRDGPRYDTE